MNEFENKGIEKFFRSKLKPTNQNTDWASPPDFIFEKAIDQVNKEEKDRKRSFAFWISLFGFIVILSTIIITQSRQLNDVQKSLDKLEEELITSQLNHHASNDNGNNILIDNNNDHSNDNYNNNQKSGYNSIDQLNNKQAGKLNASVLENRLSQSSSVENTLLTEKKNTVSIVNTNQSLSNQTNQNFVFQKNDLANNKNSSETNDQFQYNPAIQFTTTQNNSNLLSELSNATSLIDDTGRIAFQFNSISPTKRSLFNIEFSSLIAHPQFADRPDSQFDNQNRFSIAVTTGLNTATFLMENMNNLDGKSLTDYNKYYSGFQSEISFLYNVTGRFSAGVHANYFKINNQSTFDESSNLDLANMKLVNGKMEYSMPMEIITPIGSHKMNSELIFDENLNTSNLIRNQSDISQSFNSIGIGVSARYFILQKSKFSSYIGANFSHHVINKMNSEFNTTISMQDKVMKKFKTIPGEMNNNQKSYNSISAELGLQYAISPKVNVLFQSSFGKSINSLIESNIQTDPKTFLQYIDTGIGISYSL